MIRCQKLPSYSPATGAITPFGIEPMCNLNSIRIELCNSMHSAIDFVDTGDVGLWWWNKFKC